MLAHYIPTTVCIRRARVTSGPADSKIGRKISGPLLVLPLLFILMALTGGYE